jgi:hypothetical protein
MRGLANYSIGIIAAILTLVAFVEFLTSSPLKAWTKSHSSWVFYALVFFFLATGVSLNYLSEARRKYQEIRREIAPASEHDRKLFLDLMAMLPPDGAAIEWLKENFVSSIFPREHYKVIEGTLRSMRLRSLEFDNPNAEASYNGLHSAMQKFENKAVQHMWQDDSDGLWLRIPQEWDDERSSKAADDIAEARLNLVEKYDDFLRIAHKNKIDQGAT